MTASNGPRSDGDARSRDQRSPGGDSGIVFRVGQEELGIRHRYETASIVNDLMLGSWFLVGSILFLAGPVTVGTWLFLLGSLQLLIRPVIRLSRNVYVTRTTGSRHGVVMGPSSDF